MAVQKSKKSSSKTKIRRKSHKIKIPTLTRCLNCMQNKRCHELCNCGYYKGINLLQKTNLK